MAEKKSTKKTNKASHYIPVKKKKKQASSSSKKANADQINHSVKETKVAKEKAELTPEEAERLEIRRERRATLWAQIFPYIFGVFALFLAICFIKPDVMGIVGDLIHNFFFGLFGSATYIIPVFFFGHVLLWKKDVEEDHLFWRFITSIASEICLAMLLHAFATNSGSLAEFETELSLSVHWNNGMAGAGGGVFGGLMGALFITAFGRVGMLILTIAALVLLVMLFFGLTPRTIWVWVAYRIRLAKDRKEEKTLDAKKEKHPETNTYDKVYEYRKEKKATPEVSRPEEWAVPEPQVPIEEAFPPKNRRAEFNPDIPIDDPAVKQKEILADPSENGKTENPIKEKNVRPLIIPSLEEKFREASEKAKREKRSLLEALNDELKEEENIPTEEAKPLDETPVIDEAAFASILNQNKEETQKVSSQDVIKTERAASLQSEEQKKKLDPDELENVKITAQSTLSEIFVNPEDKVLIDRLAEQYLAGNNNEISTENVKNPELVKKEEVEKAPPKPKRQDNYKRPDIKLLYEDISQKDENIKDELYDNASKLVETLRSFNVKTKIVDVSRGPTITRYELLPEAGTRVRAIANLVDDISLNLATGGVRIEAPIPGKAAVGIEVPNRNPSVVHLRTLLEDKGFREHKSPLYAALGEDVAGAYVYCDIEKMPHLLIAGATGMGKSVCINSLIVSMLYKSSPDDVRMILVDPKRVELGVYNGIPHLLTPVVCDPKKASGALSWAVSEMERRFGLIEQVGVRDLKHFNEITKDDPDYEYLPQIVIIIDELADLMMTAPKEVEANICRLAQKARAAGMHLVIGTQRPSVDVITGLIKANVPSRIAFTVASQIDSRTIIDRAGAESLIGRGDMLYNPVGAQKPLRVQGAFVSDSDVEKVVDYIKRTSGVAEYDQQVSQTIEEEAARCGENARKGAFDAEEDGEKTDAPEDPMFRKAVELAIESGKISTSLIQRRLSLGYGRAAKLVDHMESLGYVSKADGQKPREILITKEEFMEKVARGNDT